MKQKTPGRTSGWTRAVLGGLTFAFVALMPVTNMASVGRVTLRDHYLNDPQVKVLLPDQLSVERRKELTEQGTAIVLWWAHCPFCNRLLTALAELEKEKKVKMTVIGVSIDRAGPEDEVRKEALERAKEWALPFEQRHDYFGRLRSVMSKTDKVPFTMIFDQHGNLVATHSGVSRSLRALTKEAKP